MSSIDILGYVAMILVAISFLLKDMTKLRFMNLLGSGCFVVYGFLTDALPVAGTNIFIVCVNIYYILASLKKNKS